MHLAAIANIKLSSSITRIQNSSLRRTSTKTDPQYNQFYEKGAVPVVNIGDCSGVNLLNFEFITAGRHVTLN
jgi:hypothetical protein